MNKWKAREKTVIHKVLCEVNVFVVSTTRCYVPGGNANLLNPFLLT